jgi:hypothetical protein
MTNRLAFGAVLGSASGIFAAALGVPGLLLLAVVVALAALVQPRYAMLAGVLIAAGGLWTFFSLRAVFFCAMYPSSCSGPAPAPFALVSGVVFAVGILALVMTRRRLGRPSDIGQRWSERRLIAVFLTIELRYESGGRLDDSLLVIEERDLWLPSS